MSKIWKKIFNKLTLTIFFFVLQLAILLLIVYFLQGAFWWIRLTLQIISFGLAVLIISHPMDNSYKITWLLFLLIMPAIGSFCYILFANKKFTKKEIAKIMPMCDQLVALSEQAKMEMILEEMKKDDEDAYNIGKYLKEYALADTFNNTKISYYPWGEEAFPVMLEKLKTARNFIFMEYFIISKGEMWDAILEVLKEKAQNGVDVRLIYDDLGCVAFPHDYPEQLAKFNIKAYRYAPLRPLLDIRMNNRDHRKILVIDGKYGFTGGINIADEYINRIVRFGKWKDNAIMLEGYGVAGLCSLFLSNYGMLSGTSDQLSFQNYLLPSFLNPPKDCKGFVVPYGSLPYTYESAGQNVYINMALKAKRYLYICTPYLVLNAELENALCLAAKNGVDVRLVMPGIPDKKTVFAVSRSFYGKLFDAGVKIYEYTPGFVHQKVFLADDDKATVGTINLDYRSLYLHMENGTFMYNTDCIKDIKNDFETIFPVCKQIGEKDAHAKLGTRIIRGILRVFAPLM